MTTFDIEIVTRGIEFRCSVSNNGTSLINIPVQDVGVTCCIDEENAKHSLIRAMQNYARATGNAVEKIEMIDPEKYETAKKI